MKELTGQLKWPDPNHNPRRKRTKQDEVPADIDGNPIIPFDFVGDEATHNAEREMAELYRRILETHVEGLRPTWEMTLKVAVVRDADGHPDVERGTYRPVMQSLRDISQELKTEGITVRLGKNAGDEIEAWQVQEWKLRAGLPRFVRFFFECHPEVLQSYLDKRREMGERAIPKEEILQRFIEGASKLLRGQNGGRKREE